METPKAITSLIELRKLHEKQNLLLKELEVCLWLRTICPTEDKNVKYAVGVNFKDSVEKSELIILINGEEAKRILFEDTPYILLNRFIKQDVYSWVWNSKFKKLLNKKWKEENPEDDSQP